MNIESPLPITAAAALVNGIWFLLMTINVALMRRRKRISLGDGDDRVVTRAIRGHGNASEQIPIALIVLALCEMRGSPDAMLAAAAITFTLGRLSHGAYFSVQGLHWWFRLVGMYLTLGAQIALLALLAASFLR